MTLKVAFITPDYADKQPGIRPSLIGGAGYYRCQLPADTLNRHSGDIHAEVFGGCWADPNTGELYPAIMVDPFNHDRLICDRTGWDIIVLQRWMAEKDRDRILHARANGQTVIQDVDDHFWSLHKANRAHSQVRREDWNAEFYRANLAASDHITTSTRYLAGHLSDLDVPVTVIPNMIDLTLWTRQPVADEVTTVGWCGHTGFRSGDLETLGNAMRYFLRDHPNITFTHGGYDPTSTHIADLLNIPKTRVNLRSQCPINVWPRVWQGIDLAILPLNNIDFNAAKSDIKYKEAAASGVPVVMTGFGPYADLPGISVGSPQGWRNALENMLEYDLRQQLQDQAYAYVQHHDAAIRWTDWADLYRNLSNERRAA